MNRKRLLKASLVFSFAAIALAWLLYHFEAKLLDSLLPSFRVELSLLMPEFRLDHLDWRFERNEAVFVLTATLTEHRVVLGRALPPGVSINASTLAAHSLLHPVLIISLLVAWPTVPWKRKPFLLLFGLPFVLLAELLDVPLMLWGTVEDFLYWQTDPARVAASLGSRVQHFLDGGGRYALSILLALGAVILFQKILPATRTTSVMNNR